MNGEESRVEFESGAGFSTKNVIEKIVADGASVIPAELTRISDAYLKCDIREWQPLVDCIVSVCVTSIEPIAAKDQTTVATDRLNNYDIIPEFALAALRFMKRLLHFCENKKYFMAFEGLEILLSSKSKAIVRLVLDVFCEYMKPCKSAVPAFEESCRPQLPKSCLKKILAMNVGFSFSAQDYGILEYIQGHLPVLSSVDEIIISYSVKPDLSGRDPRRSPFVTDIAVNLEKSMHIDVHYQEICFNLPFLDNISRLSLISSIRAAKALFTGNILQRLEIVLLRLKCLFLLLSCDRPINGEGEMLTSEAAIFKDIFRVANISNGCLNEIFAPDLSLKDEIHVCALDCIVAMLMSEINFRTGGLTTYYPWLLPQVGINRVGLDSRDERQDGDPWWLSLLTTASVLAAASLRKMKKIVMRAGEDGTSISLLPKKFIEMDFDSSQLYFHGALEIFSGAMSFHVDDSAIASAAAVFRSFIDAAVSKLIHKPEEHSGHTILDILCTLGYALNLICECEDRREMFLKTFGEVGGTVIVIRFLEAFPVFYKARKCYSDGSSVEEEFGVEYEKCLTYAMSLLAMSICENQNFHASSDRDIVIQFVYRSSFSELCSLICDNQKQMRTNLLLVYTCEIISSTIDMDPGYLSQFIGNNVNSLASTVINGILGGLRRGEFSPLSRKQLCYLDKEKSIFLAAVTLASSMCITTMGRDVVLNNDFIVQVISAMIKSVHVSPISEGLPTEEIQSIGAVIGNFIKGHDGMKLSIIQKLQEIIFQLSCEADIHGGLSDVKRQCVTHKILNACTLIESIGGDIRRNSGNIEHVLKHLYNEVVIKSLMKLYRLTLPCGRQLLSQISLHNNWASAAVHYGNGAAAKAVTSVIRMAINSCSSEALKAILAAIDICISDVLTAKSNLFTLISDTGRRDDSSNIAMEDLDSPSSLEPGTLIGFLDLFPDNCIFDRKIAQFCDKRDKGSSKSSVEISPVVSENINSDAAAALLSESKDLNVPLQSQSRKLPCSLTSLLPPVPPVSALHDKSLSLYYPSRRNSNRCDSLHDSSHSSLAISESSVTCTEIEKVEANLIFAMLYLEWLSWIISHCLHPIRAPGAHLEQAGLMEIGQETLRRLMIFYKTSLIETCWFSASRWSSSAQSAKDSFNDLVAGGDDYTKDDMNRCPTHYTLRVVAPLGALIRENSEIEGSQIVRVAPSGTMITAYERCRLSTGVIRYRCAQGWLSEFNRDHQRMPIVEVIDISSLPSLEERNHSQTNNINVDSAANIGAVKELHLKAMTLREAACYVMTRVQTSLRLIIVQLARNVVGNYSGVGASRIQREAPNLAQFLSGTVKDLLVHPFEGNFSTHIIPSFPMRESSDAVSSIQIESEIVSRIRKRNCIYFGIVFKNIIAAIIEDRAGYINIYLLRKFVAEGVVKDISKSFTYVKTILFELSPEINIMGKGHGVCQNSGVARCAKACLTAILPTLCRIVKKEGHPSSNSKKYFFHEDNFNSKAFGRGNSTMDIVLSALYFSMATEFLVHYNDYHQFSRLSFGLQRQFLSVVADIIHGLFEHPTNRLMTSIHNYVRLGGTAVGLSPSTVRPPADNRWNDGRNTNDRIVDSTTGVQDIMRQLLMTMGYPSHSVSAVLENTQERNLNFLMERLEDSRAIALHNADVLVSPTSSSPLTSINNAEVVPNSAGSGMQADDNDANDDADMMRALELSLNAEVPNNSVTLGAHFAESADRPSVTTELNDECPVLLHTEANSSATNEGPKNEMVQSVFSSIWDTVGLGTELMKIFQENSDRNFDIGSSAANEFVRTVVTIADTMEYPYFWFVSGTSGSEEGPQTLGAELCYFIERLQLLAKVPDASREKKDIISQLLESVSVKVLIEVLVDKVVKNNPDHCDDNKFFGSCHLILSLLCYNPTRVPAFTSLSRKKASQLILAIFCHVWSSKTVSKYLPWITPALLLISELVSCPYSADTSLDGLNYLSTIESKEEDAQQDSKMEDNFDVNCESIDIFSNLEKQLSSFILINDAQCLEIFAHLDRMLLNEENSFNLLIRDDSNAIHAFILLLIELLNRQVVADVFVESSGLLKLLMLRTETVLDASGSLLSALVIKCARTRSILRSQMIDDIQELFTVKPSEFGLAAYTEKILLPNFLAKCSAMLALDVSVFLDAAGDAVVYSFQDNTSVDPKNTVLIHVSPINFISDNTAVPFIRPEQLIRHVRAIHSIDLEEVSGQCHWPKWTFRCNEEYDKVKNLLDSKIHTIRSHSLKFMVEQKVLPPEIWVRLKKPDPMNAVESANYSMLSLPDSRRSLYDAKSDGKRVLILLQPLITAVHRFAEDSKFVVVDGADLEKLWKDFVFKPANIILALTDLLLVFPKSAVFPDILVNWNLLHPPELADILQIIDVSVNQKNVSWKSKNSFIYLLMSTYLRPLSATLKTASPIVDTEIKHFQMNVVRFIVAISTFSGNPRNCAVLCLLDHLKQAVDSDTDVQSGDNNSAKMVFIYRVCRLLVLVVTPADYGNVDAAYGDALSLLVQSGAPQLLAEVMDKVILSHSKVDKVVSAGLKLLDLLTKPQILRLVASAMKISGSIVSGTIEVGSSASPTSRLETPSFRSDSDQAQDQVLQHDFLRYGALPHHVDQIRWEDGENHFVENGDENEEIDVSNRYVRRGHANSEDDDSDSDEDEDDEEEIFEDQEEDFPILPNQSHRLLDEGNLPVIGLSSNLRPQHHLAPHNGETTGNLMIFSSTRPVSRHNRRQDTNGLTHNNYTPHGDRDSTMQHSSNANEDFNDFGASMMERIPHPSFVTPPEQIRRHDNTSGDDPLTDVDYLQFLNGRNRRLLPVQADLLFNDTGYVDGLHEIVRHARVSRVGVSSTEGGDVVENMLNQRGAAILGSVGRSSSFQHNDLRLPLLNPHQRQNGNRSTQVLPFTQLIHPLLVPIRPVRENGSALDSSAVASSGLEAYWNGDRLDAGDATSVLIEHNFGGHVQRGNLPSRLADQYSSNPYTEGHYSNIDMGSGFVGSGSRINGVVSQSINASPLRTLSSALETSVIRVMTQNLVCSNQSVSSEQLSHSTGHIVRLTMCDSSSFPSTVSVDDVVSFVGAFRGVNLTPINGCCDHGSMCWQFSCSTAEDLLVVSMINRTIISSHEVCFSADIHIQANHQSNDGENFVAAPVEMQAEAATSSDETLPGCRNSGDMADAGAIGCNSVYHSQRVGDAGASTIGSLSGGGDGDDFTSYYSDATSQFEGDTTAQHPRAYLLRRPVFGTNLSGYIISSTATVNTNISDMTRELADVDNISATDFRALVFDEIVQHISPVHNHVYNEIDPENITSNNASPQSLTSSRNSSPLSSLSFASHQESIGSSVMSGSALGNAHTPRGRRMDQSLSVTSRVPEDEEGIIFDAVDGDTVVSALGGISHVESGNVSIASNGDDGESIEDDLGVGVIDENELHLSAGANSHGDPDSVIPDSQLNQLQVAQSLQESAVVESAVVLSTTSAGPVCPAGYDIDVFNSLPEDMQMEIIEQALVETNSDDLDQLLVSAGYDIETVNALPESFRREIVDQIRREQQETAGAAAHVISSTTPAEDNIAFLMSLPQELRAEVLLTSDSVFIASLPPELIAEATQLRERMAVRFQDNEIQELGNDDEDAEEEEEEEDSEVYDTGFRWRGDSADPRRRTANYGMSVPVRSNGVNNSGFRSFSANGNQNVAQFSRTRPGWLLLGDLIEQPVLKLSVLKFVIKVLFIDKFPVQASSLKRFCYNITRHESFREFMARNFTALLSSFWTSPHSHVLTNHLDEKSIYSDSKSCLDDSSRLLQPPSLEERRDSANESLLWIPITMISCENFALADSNDDCRNCTAVPADITSDFAFSHIKRSPVRPNKSTIVCTGDSENAAANLISTSPVIFNAISPDGGLSAPLPQPVMKRILGILKYLIRTDEATVYEFLRPRHGFFGIPKSDDSSSLLNYKSMSHENSTYSLLESLIRCFHETSIEESSVCLDSVANVVDIICRVIAESEANSSVNDEHGCNAATSGNQDTVILSQDALSENLLLSPNSEISCAIGRTSDTLAHVNLELPTSNDAATKSSSVEVKSNSVDIYKLPSHEKWEKVPVVRMQAETLHILCNALILENCSKTSFEHITNAIKSLSQSPLYRDVLSAVLREVVVDLSNQSQRKLQDFLDVKKSSPTNKLHTASADEIYKTSSTLCEEIQPIFLGDIGGTEHERLYRTLNILHSIVSNTVNREDALESDTNFDLKLDLPLADIFAVWNLLHETLNVLEYEVDGSVNSSNILGLTEEDNTSSPALHAVLVKLLPLINLFFIVYSSRLLAESSQFKDMSSVPVSRNSESKEGLEDLTPVKIPKLDHVQSLPGDKYRLSASFRRRNIVLQTPSNNSFESNNVLENTSALKSAASFRRTTSVGRGSAVFNFMDPHLSGGSRLLSFVYAHKKSLNELIKRKPEFLESGPLSAMMRIVQLRTCLSFQNKTMYFLSELKKTRGSHGRRSIHMQVRRENVFEDSFQALRVRSISDWRGRLSITFHGEEGIDAGGLTREWYQVLAREIFNPNYALFTAAADGATFQPNPLSNINMNHLDYFKFVGRIIGKAIVDGHLMDAHFTKSFYKHVLGIPVDYTDIEALEPDYFKSLKQMLEFSLEDLGLELTFSADVELFGKHNVVDLVPNGSRISVTDTNKPEYVKLLAQHRMTTAIRSQIDVFLEGFHDMVPAELISIFTPTELELLICGLPDVNIEDLRANTDYQQCRATDDCIMWLWEILRDFSREDRALFLQFVTGTSKVPLNGFAGLQGIRGPQRFSIHRSHSGRTALPTAHTCFNQLDLPMYPTKEELEEKLLMAIKEGSEGFGFS